MDAERYEAQRQARLAAEREALRLERQRRQAEREAQQRLGYDLETFNYLYQSSGANLGHSEAMLLAER